MAANIDQLQIEIKASSTQAVSNLNALVSAMDRLKASTQGGTSGLSVAATRIQKLATSLNSIKATSASSLRSLSSALSSLSAVQKPANLTSAANAINKLVPALSALSAVSIPSGKIQQISSAMATLSTVGKAAGLSSTIATLKKLPEISAQLEKTNLGTFATQMKRVADAIRPLANEMQKVSNGFAAFPIRIQKLIASNAGLVASNNRVTQSFNLFGSSIFATISRITVFGYSIKRVLGWFKSWVGESSAYVENLNLFTVTMGDATEEALAFADAAHEALGIDPSQFIRNWGIFQNTLTGFGVVTDKAELMSKNLTELAYDLASFFDTSVETAMEKLQSSMTGQVRPLREFGYAIDQATLQQVAYAHGIDESVAKMSQAQKAQLRYVTIMEHSQNVMGDMGRTIMTPANAMRVFGEQITQLTRALGNLFIPVLSKVLPYVQAFVEVLTEAIQKLAVMIGFKIPEIDYSGLDGVTSGAGALEDELGAADDEAKKLKKTLLGFDELNILSDTSKTVSGVGNDLDINLPEYDFLANVKNQTKKIKAEINKFFADIKKAIEPFEPLLKGIATAFALAFGFKWVADAITKFAGIGAISGILAALGKSLATAAIAFTLTQNPILALGAAIGSLWASFKTFMSGLSPFAKAMVTVIGVLAEFVTVKNAIYDLAKGNISLLQALANIIPMTALVGTALYAMLGPIGLVITGVAALAGAILGYAKAQNELREQSVEATFFDGQGVAIQELADHYSSLAMAIGNSFDGILALGDTMESAQSSVDLSVASLDAFAFGIENGLYTAEEVLPQIEQEFSAFKDNMQTILDGAYDMVVMALGGSIGDAAKQAEIDLTAYYSTVADASVNLNKEMDEISDLYSQYNDELNNGMISSEQYGERLRDLTQRMQELSLTETESQINSLNNEIVRLLDIDWGADTALTDAKNALASFGTSSEEAKTKIAEAYDLMTDKFTLLRKGAATDEDRLRFDVLIGLNETAMKADLAKIDTLSSQFAAQMQGNLIEELQTVYDKEMSEWNNLDWLQKLFYGFNQADYVSRAVEDYKNNIVVPLTDEMKIAMGSALSDDDVWAVDAVSAVTDQVFNSFTLLGVSGGIGRLTKFAGDMKTAIDDALANAGFNESGAYVANTIADSVIMCPSRKSGQ